jgi:hypothetical protein
MEIHAESYLTLSWYLITREFNFIRIDTANKNFIIVMTITLSLCLAAMLYFMPLFIRLLSLIFPLVCMPNLL